MAIAIALTEKLIIKSTIKTTISTFLEAEKYL
jgi:hypothetical protein